MQCGMCKWDSLPSRWKKGTRLSRTSEGSNNGLWKRRDGCSSVDPCRLDGVDARSRSRLSNETRKWKRVGGQNAKGIQTLLS